MRPSIQARAAGLVQEARQEIGNAKQQAQQFVDAKVEEVKVQAEQYVQGVQSQAAVAVDQAAAQVAHVQAVAANAVQEGIVQTQNKAEGLFATRMGEQSAIMIRTMEQQFAAEISGMHHPMKEE